jgi:hypothetical protein
VKSAVSVGRRRAAGAERPYVITAYFTDALFVGNFVENFVDRAFAGKVFDKVSNKDGRRRW